jgi:hypothetical protein
MFGLNEQEMELYRDFTHDFAVKEVAPKIVGHAQFLTPAVKQGDEYVHDSSYLRCMILDVETIITLTAVNMGYEYAYLQSEDDKTEKEIIDHLHEKYDSYINTQFIKYAVACSADVTKQIVGDLILELPYIYVSIFEDENFDEEDFLEKKLEAYNDYLNENFTDEELDEDFEEDLEEDFEEE